MLIGRNYFDFSLGSSVSVTGNVLLKFVAEGNSRKLSIFTDDLENQKSTFGFPVNLAQEDVAPEDGSVNSARSTSFPSRNSLAFGIALAFLSVYW